LPLMADPTWTTRERPILEAVRAAEEAGEDLSGAARGAMPDAPIALYGRTIQSLAADDYLDASVRFQGNGEPYLVIVTGLAPRGRRAIGQWPSEDVGAELERVLTEQIAGEHDPERKSRLERLRATVADVGLDIMKSVLVELGTRATLGR